MGITALDQRIRVKANPFQPVVGLFMPCWNDRPLVERAVCSLEASMPYGYRYGLIAVDGGSTDGTTEWLTKHDIPWVALPQPRKNGMNEMVELWLGSYDPVSDCFAREGLLDFVGFIHTDADYNLQAGWLGRLADKYNPTIGCIGPAHNNETRMLGHGLHPANCPIFIISVQALKLLYRTHGWWIDPNYWTGTSYCDWDMQWNLKKLGLRSVIDGDATVDHFCQGTRARLWTTDENFRRRDNENREYYYSKWPRGVNPLEAL